LLGSWSAPEEKKPVQKIPIVAALVAAWWVLVVVETSADNALAESINAALKREVLQGLQDLCQSLALPQGGIRLLY